MQAVILNYRYWTSASVAKRQITTIYGNVSGIQILWLTIIRQNLKNQMSKRARSVRIRAHQNLQNVQLTVNLLFRNYEKRKTWILRLWMLYHERLLIWIWTDVGQLNLFVDSEFCARRYHEGSAYNGFNKIVKQICNIDLIIGIVTLWKT